MGYSRTWARISAFILFTILNSQLAHASCASDSLVIQWEGGKARFDIEIADTVEKRNTGLMFREKLSSSAGMLFIYEKPQRASFWMKNTLIPLDLLFADKDGIITHIHQSAQPGDLTGIDGGDYVKFTLEINGGLAKRLGITEGAQMHHSSINPQSAICAIKK